MKVRSGRIMMGQTDCASSEDLARGIGSFLKWKGAG